MPNKWTALYERYSLNILCGLMTTTWKALWLLLFTMNELEEEALSIKNKKAPGPDSIPIEVYKLFQH